MSDEAGFHLALHTLKQYNITPFDLVHYVLRSRDSNYSKLKDSMVAKLPGFIHRLISTDPQLPLAAISIVKASIKQQAAAIYAQEALEPHNSTTPSTSDPTGFSSVLLRIARNPLSSPSILSHIVYTAAELCAVDYRRNPSASTPLFQSFMTTIESHSDLHHLAPTSPFHQAIMQHAIKICSLEIEFLSSQRGGYHMRSTKEQADHILSMETMGYCEDYERKAPHTCALIRTLLGADLQAKARRNNATQENTNTDPSSTPPDISMLELAAAVMSSQESELTDLLEDYEINSQIEQVLDQQEAAHNQKHRNLRHADRDSRAKELCKMMRNDALESIKLVAIISILMQSSNVYANSWQTVNSLTLSSEGISERMGEMLSHMGISLSTRSMQYMINMMSKAAETYIQTLIPRSGMPEPETQISSSYDNLEFMSRSANHGDTFISVTSVLFFRQPSEIKASVYQCSDYLWQRNMCNLLANEAEAASFAPKLIHQVSHDDIFPLNLPDINTRLKTRLEWHIRRMLVEYAPGFDTYASELGPILASDLIVPLRKTEIIPGRLLDISEGSVDGNIQVQQAILKQLGLKPEDVKDRIILNHADLGTNDHSHTAKKMRSYQTDGPHPEYDRGQHVRECDGLFHKQMARTDYMARQYCSYSLQKSDPHSLYNQVFQIRVKHADKLLHKPTHRILHDVTHYTTTAQILECWRLEAARRGHPSLKALLDSKPQWEILVAYSESILSRNVAGPELIRSRQKPLHQRDQVFENAQLFLRDGLMYIDSGEALKYGDIGRYEDQSTYAMWLFKSVGKHRYAAQELRRQIDINKVYSKELAEAVLLSSLANTNGRKDGHRPIDWHVEQANLAHKVIHKGRGPNGTKELMIMRSILIELFRAVRKLSDKNFYVRFKSLHHTGPSMQNAINKLSGLYQKLTPHKFQAGRTAVHSFPDPFQVGSERCLNDYVENDKFTVHELEDDASMLSAVEESDLAT